MGASVRVGCRRTVRCLCGDTPVFRGLKNATCGRKLRAALTLSRRFGRPRRGCGAVRIKNAGNGNSYDRALATVLRRTKCGINLCASPRLASFERHVHMGNRVVPRRGIIRFVRGRHSFFRPFRPSFFRLAATLTFGRFTRRRISITIVRMNLKKHLSYAGVVQPSLSVVAGVDFSRIRFLKRALRRVTRRGTKVVGTSVPIVVNRAAARAGGIFRDGSLRVGTFVEFTRRRRRVGSSRATGNFHVCRAGSCNVLEKTLGKLYRRGGATAVLATIGRLRGRKCGVRARRVGGKFLGIYRAAKLHKH